MRVMIFVFGSNESGLHGAGAAKYAHLKEGAIIGIGFGIQGTSFGIPTKDWNIQSLSLIHIEFYVERFIAFAKLHQEADFKVTQIGCGLAGNSPEEIAPMFRNAPENCYFDEAWKPYLGKDRKYWGHQ
jgi:hypothetical protein